MSRIGKNPIAIPAGVTLTQSGQVVTVKGAKGELSFTLPDAVTGKLEDGTFTLSPVEGAEKAKAMWGMSRTMVLNMVVGVTDGFKKDLELRGVGYRAAMKGSTLNLQLGYSHEINYDAPDGITITVGKPTEISIAGIDKQEGKKK